MKKALALALFAMIAAPMFASVELNTSISDVYHRGSNELAGSISMNVTSDDFRDASTAAPVYIRITTDRNSVLAETLVNRALDLDATIDVYTNYLALPINLAMSLDSNQDGVSIAADPTAVSIVRWVENESSLWIRVQQSSEEWLNLLGVGLVGPSENREVEWTFGVSARSSDSDHRSAGEAGYIETEGSNLPFNTRNPDVDDTVADYQNWATSTLICVDLSNSNLQADGTDDSLLKYDIISYDEEADLGNGGYSGNTGNQNTINFTNDFTIARGKSRACYAELTDVDKSAAGRALLCINQAQTNGSAVNEFVTLENQMTVRIWCDTRSVDSLETRWYPGSFLTFETPSDSAYGFYDGTQGFEAAMPGFIDRPFVLEVDGLAGIATTEGTAFSSHGRNLYRKTNLEYTGVNSPIIGGAGIYVSVNVPVQQHYTEDAGEASVDWSVTLKDHDGQRDTAPYDGTFDPSFPSEFGGGVADQDRRCPPSDIPLEGGTFTIGEFVICTGNPVSLFFPYLPKIVGNSDFWVGLSYVNQGNVELDVIAHVYDEDGNLFVAELGPIAVREQRTWLFSDVAGQATFTGAGNNNADASIIPASADPVVGSDLAGTTRSSMFVVGTFETQFNNFVNSGDLDGYMLVGNAATNSIDGAYLPRNWDVDGGQAADLPLNRSKN